MGTCWNPPSFHPIKWGGKKYHNRGGGRTNPTLKGTFRLDFLVSTGLAKNNPFELLISYLKYF
jgi:hypothetical protein